MLVFDHEVAQLIGVSLIGVVWVLELRFRAASSSQCQGSSFVRAPAACLNAARAVAAGYRGSGFVQWHQADNQGQLAKSQVAFAKAQSSTQLRDYPMRPSHDIDFTATT